ncbi:hypothetical protein ACFSTC_22710 [Nonomuraea ferruginea]
MTLSPVTQDGASPPEEILDRAVNIIRDRVNGTGISDAEVAKSGDNIIISIPGVGQSEAIKLVATTAELRFRQVLAMEMTPIAQEQLATEAPSPDVSPTASTAPSPTPSVAPSQSARPQPSGSPSVSPTGKALSSALTDPAPSTSPTPSQGDRGNRDKKSTPSPSATDEPAPDPNAQTPQPADRHQGHRPGRAQAVRRARLHRPEEPRPGSPGRPRQAVRRV